MVTITLTQYELASLILSAILIYVTYKSTKK